MGTCLAGSSALHLQSSGLPGILRGPCTRITPFACWRCWTRWLPGPLLISRSFSVGHQHPHLVSGEPGFGARILERTNYLPRLQPRGSRRYVKCLSYYQEHRFLSPSFAPQKQVKMRSEGGSAGCGDSGAGSRLQLITLPEERGQRGSCR